VKLANVICLFVFSFYFPRQFCTLTALDSIVRATPPNKRLIPAVHQAKLLDSETGECYLFV
jgi:hypothetical protein